jgi:translation elongation factor EF-4
MKSRCYARELKFKCLGLASLARSIARQHSRLTFLREGDANTEFFHLQVCHRGHTNFIDRLQHQGCNCVYELEKSQVVFYHFDDVLGSSVECTTALDFNVLNVPSVDLTELDFCFLEELGCCHRIKSLN